MGLEENFDLESYAQSEQYQIDQTIFNEWQKRVYANGEQLGINFSQAYQDKVNTIAARLNAFQEYNNALTPVAPLTANLTPPAEPVTKPATTLWKLNDMFVTRPQVAANDFLNAFKNGDHLFVPDAAHGFMDKWQQNFKYKLEPINPAFIDATLSYEDMEDCGYRLEYNPNRVLWRVNAAGIPHPDDYYKYLEQQRIIKAATDSTLAEVEPLAKTSQVAEDSSRYLTVKGPSADKREQASGHPRIINPYAGGVGESKVGEANRTKAIEYALKYANNTSDHDGFHFFGAALGSGSDCANYVSQCLFAGGIPMSEGWNWKGLSYAGWREMAKEVGFDHPAVQATASWVQPDALYRYFSQPGRCYGVSYITSVDDIPRVAAYIKPGDIIAFNNLGEHNPKGYINHVAIVNKVENGEIYYCGHTDARNNDRLSVILSGQNYQGDLYFIHVNYDQ